MNNLNVHELDWKKGNGIIPAIIQDYQSREILMLGFMNQEALRTTLSTKRVTLFSRSRQTLWVKGETSGNYLNLVEIATDCDNDAILILADPEGPTCHTGTRSCFKTQSKNFPSVLQRIESVIIERSKEQAADSYTVSLLKSGIDRIARKIGEESVETIIAALKESDDRLCNEISDLFYHILVLLNFRKLSIVDVLSVLQSRLDIADILDARKCVF